MRHWNKNVLVSFTTKLTSTNPVFARTAAFCFLPLKGLEPLSIPAMAHLQIDTKLPCDGLEPEDAAKCRQQGLDPLSAIEMLEEWWEKVDTKWKKYGLTRGRIMLLGADVPAQISALRRWLGEGTYATWFHDTPRDVCMLAHYMNDRAGWRGEKCPYSHQRLKYIANQHKLPYSRNMDMMEECALIAQVYSEMVRTGGLF